MKVRAIAAASERSNAVGALELECSPQGLVAGYVGVSTYADGYAPGVPAEPRTLTIPWQKITAAQATGEHLWLEVDPEVTPHNKVLLTHFSEGSDVPSPEVERRRGLYIVSGSTILIIVLLLSLYGAPGFSRHHGAWAALSLGVLVALAMVGFALISSKLQSNRDQVAAERFLADLTYYYPTLLRGGELPRKPRARLLQETLPRSTTAITITLTACTLGALLTFAWAFRQTSAQRAASPTSREDTSPRAQPPTSSVQAASPPAVMPNAPAPAPAAPAPPVPSSAPGSACVCDRSDSVLWKDPIPRLTPLLIEQKSRSHKNHSHLELELAVVNNTKNDVNDVTMEVQFYEQGAQDKAPRPTKLRPLYFEGPLRPGHAIKWHVEARGTSFEVQRFGGEALDPNGTDTAPADEFAQLLEANHRPVRLHAAMMLAFLGDERARAGALALRDALRDEEGPYLSRVLQAVSPVRMCDLQVSGAGTQFRLNGCIYNSGVEGISGLGVLARALDSVADHRSPVSRPPLVLAEQVFDFAPSLPPSQGQRVEVGIDTTNPDGTLAKEFELVVDRLDVLH